MIMPRNARLRSKSGLYHVVMRGIDRQNIFYNDVDYQHFIDTLGKVKTEDRFELYGYCLMSNHVHLLIYEKSEEIPQIMKRIVTSYAWWFNMKYERSGHVFQGRYGSECVEDDRYLLTVIRYIHQNPVKAGMVDTAEDYRWSSIRAYYSGREYQSSLTDIDFILEIFAPDKTEAISRFREHMNMEVQDSCLEIEVKLRKTDEQLKADIEALLNGMPITSLHGFDKKKRDEVIRQIKLIDGATQRQIARVIGLNQNIVFKAR